MSKKYNLVKKYYDSGFWNKEMIRNAVDKEWITEEEFKRIVGDE